MEKLIKEMFKEIPKVFRYLVPGFIFLVLFKLCFPRLLETIIGSDTNYYMYYILLSFFPGLVIYQIHRSILWWLDEGLFWCFKRKTCWTFFKKRYGKIEHVVENEDKQNLIRELRAIIGYMEHRNSILHSCLITSELFFIFSLLALKGVISEGVIYEHATSIIWFSGAFFLISIAQYIYITLIELHYLPFDKVKK